MASRNGGLSSSRGFLTFTLSKQVHVTMPPEALLTSPNILVSVRPEHISLSRTSESNPTATGILGTTSFSGSVVRARITTPSGSEVVADVSTHDWLRIGLRKGDRVAWHVREGASVLLPETDL